VIDNPSTTRTGDQFGLTVAATNGGFAVGAPLDAGHGTVYVYSYDGSTATLTRAISETLAPSGDEFGRALASVGNRLLIGAPNDDLGANNAGVAYLYDLNGTRVYTFTNPVPHENDRFGSAVAGNAALIAIGASNDDAGAVDAGAVHLYDAATYQLLITLQKDSPALGEQFGFSLAALDNDIAAGAHLDNTGAAGAGAVYRLGLSIVHDLFLPIVRR
jgi:hypothetical protein